jgi:carboxymethylenebutenolidase
MCYDLDSTPPVPVVAGAAVDHRDLVLEATDGNRFAAFAAFPAEPSGAGVVILPDIRGLYGFYEELALRFAERGHAAVAIDYFGRTAGAEKRGDDFDYRAHVPETTHEGVQADIAAAVGFLRSDAGGSCDTVWTVGFCYGGAASWVAAACGHGIAGAVGLYGRPLLRRNGGPSPVDLVGQIDAPILALMGGADEGIPISDVEAFEEALTAAGVAHELEVYDGAPHGFFDRKFEEHAEASADAWRRMLEFIGGGVPVPAG